MSVLSRALGPGRRGKRTGGEYLRDYLDAVAGPDLVLVDGDPTWSHEPCVFVYRVDGAVDGASAHFLYITHGVSRTTSSQPVAGTQTELTLRVPVTDPTIPPAWPIARLKALARYARGTDHPIEPGHYMDLHGPVTAGANLTAFIFVNDPVLKLVELPTGVVRFVYTVGVRSDELDAALSWDPLRFAGVLGEAVPLGLSNPTRASILDIASFNDRIAASTAEEGSSIAAVSAAYFAVDMGDGGTRIDMDPNAATHLLRALRHRLSHARAFAIMGDMAWARFLPADTAAPSGIESSTDSVTINLNHDLLNEFKAVFDAEPGVYRFTSVPLVITVIDPNR